MPRHAHPAERGGPAGTSRPERGALTARLRAAGFRWSRGGRPVLDLPELILDGAGLILLAGGTGSGKSSLLRALTGTLAELQGGRVEGALEARLDDGTPPRIGYLPQDPLDGLLGFDAETEFQLRLQADGWTRDEAIAETQARLRRLGYEGKEHVPVAKLSGGERKRLALRAIQAHEPHLLLLDEPLNDLDGQWQAEIFEDILAASESGLVVVADHDVDRWLPVARRILVLRDGAILWEGEADAFDRLRDDFPEIRNRALPRRFVAPPRHHGPAILRARGLRADRGRPLFRDLDLDLPAGLHAIVGPNGSGKTTLLHLLAGLRAPEGGVVYLGPTDMAQFTAAERAQRVAVLFEQPGRYFFLPTVLEEIGFQPANTGRSGFETETVSRRAAERMRLTPHLAQEPSTLSGGQQERTALAGLEASGARLLILDEPTHGLDAHAWNDLAEFIDRHRPDDCIVVATHEPDLIEIADTVHAFEESRLRPIRLGTANTMVEVVLRGS